MKFSIAFLACLAGAGLLADPLPTYTLGNPRPATLRVTGDPAENEWLSSNAVFVATAGFVNTNAVSIVEDTTGEPVASVWSEAGFSWERQKPEYYLGDRVTPPADVDWHATRERYEELYANGDPRATDFLLNPSDADPCIYIVHGGSVVFEWVLRNGSTNSIPYVAGTTAGGRPKRIYWTDSPYNSPPVSLNGKFVRLFGDPAILTVVKGTVTNVIGGVETVEQNKIVRGVYIDDSTGLMYASGRLTGQFVLAYYDTGDYQNILCVEVVEVARPEVIVRNATIGEAVTPDGRGYNVEGLKANVRAGVGVTADNRGDYLYQHAGKFSYSPKHGEVFPIRPTEGEHWNAEICWMETDPMDVQWPFELDQYECRWPANPQVYVRGNLTGEDGNPDYGAKIVIPAEYAVSLQKYQEPEGHAIAPDDKNEFYTKGEGWSLLKLTTDDDVWFMPIRSICRTNANYYTMTPSRVNVGSEIRPRGGTRSGIVFARPMPCVFTVNPDTPGYIYRAASGVGYDANLYCEENTNTLSSAIFPVVADGSTIETWWSEDFVLPDMPKPVSVPALPQVYRPVWPEIQEAPQIVIASQEGSANETVWQANGAAYFDDVYALMQLPNRRYFPGGSGTVMFWTRAEHYADADPTCTNTPSRLLTLGSTNGMVVVSIGGEHGDRLQVRTDDEIVIESPLPALKRVNEWVHVALIFDADETTLCLNGTNSVVTVQSGAVSETLSEFLTKNTLGNRSDIMTDILNANSAFSPAGDVAPGREVAEVLFSLDKLSPETIDERRYRIHTGSEGDVTGYFSFRPGEDLETLLESANFDFRRFKDRVGHLDCLAVAVAYVAPGAPARGRGVIAAEKQPKLYYQNDRAAVGFNPNDEHAFVEAGSGGYVAWALRCDLCTDVTPPPGVFVEYEKDGKAALQFFHVLLTNETWSSLSGTCYAGQALPGPHPIDTFDDPWLPEDNWDAGAGANGPCYRDRKGQLWARAAGTLPIRMYYAQQEGFWFPQYDKFSQPDVGTPVPWLSLLGREAGTDPLTADPALWTWNVIWPENVPTMKIGQTLTVASGELPEVWNAKSMAVVYPDPGEAEATVMLSDPTVLREVPLDFKVLSTLGLSVDKGGGLVFSGGRYSFTELPPSLSSRLYYDATVGRLCFVGVRDERKAGVTVLYPNVLTDSERQDVLDLVNPEMSGTHAVEYAQWVDAVRSLAIAPVVPNRTIVSGTELSVTYTNVDHYALTALGHTNYVVLIENDSKLKSMGVAEEDPVNMKIFRVVPEYYTGRIVSREDEVNLLSQRLSVLYSDPFGGKGDDFVFEWRSAEPGADGSMPTAFDDVQIYRPRASAADNGVGETSIVIGRQGDTLADMVNKYWICRYRATDASSPAYETMGTNWSAWCAPPALAEGWIQRVLNNVTPFNQRMTDLMENPAETAVSMLQQAGAPFDGDVALNQDNVASVGLIQLYETLLNKAESMSLMLGINNGAANKQLLLAAERLGDLYKVLGDEAYSDAKNPTIGFGSNVLFPGVQSTAVDFGSLSSSLFCFDNQVSSLLDEELALLRGRTGQNPWATRSGPYYNRLIWNFTKGITAGEVAYAVNYGIGGTETVALGEEQAAALYPQGHGDAYGHYLSALKGWYRLLRNPYFSWGVPSQTEMVVADATVNVDYYEEAKFAEAAADLARTAADVTDLSARKSWRDGGTSGAGYLDEVPDRGFGFGEWACRGAYGALVNWATANSLLPVDATTLDPDEFNALFSDPGLTRIDRGTVDELDDICTAAAQIQSAVDRADAGLNPLGLSDTAIPFDITPIGADDGTHTHYEQIRERAGTALRNARMVLDRAQEQSSRLKMIQETAETYAEQIASEEEDMEAELIGYFGSPYSDDIGPSGTYDQGYEGPDYIHYMWMDLSKFGLTDVQDTIAVEAVHYKELGTYHKHWYNMITALGGAINSGLNDLKESNKLCYEFSGSGLVVKPASITGSRPYSGSIQEKYGAFLMQYLATKQALSAYNNAVSELEYEMDFSTMMSWIYFTKWGIKQAVAIYKQVSDYQEAGVKMAINSLDYALSLEQATQNTLIKSAPETLGAGMTVVTSPRSIVEAVVADALLTGYYPMETTKLTLKNSLITSDIAGIMAAYAEDEIMGLLGYYQEIGEVLADVKSAAATVNERYNDLVTAVAALNVSVADYNREVGDAQTLMEKREALRRRRVSAVSQLRYNDMLFRRVRDKALTRYSASFDLAQKYTFLAAQAYDYETGRPFGDSVSGDGFKSKIIGARSLGAFDSKSGEPLVGDSGDVGLAGYLAQMDANWLVLKGRLGVNNPQPYATWFSLRRELLRILPDEKGDAVWAKALSGYWRDDIRTDPEIMRYCQPFDMSSGPVAKEPGLVIPFETTIDFAKNLFGRDLAGGDSAYDSSWYSTRIAAAGVWFDGYNAKSADASPSALSALSKTPVVYLVPVGHDRMRAPGLADGSFIQYNVIDQTIAAPYALDASRLDDESWFPSSADGDLAEVDAAVRIRRHPSFRAYYDTNGRGGEPTDAALDAKRLIGRSVWNTRWLLVIPAGGLGADREKALSVFINGLDSDRDGRIDIQPVRDIRIGFKTYSQSGN